MERVFGRHRAEVKTLAGVYGAAYEGDAASPRSRRRSRASPRRRGGGRGCWWSRWARTGTTAGAKVIATAFADIGFDVDVGPLFQTPEEAAQDAVDNDVHVVGISSQAAGHKTLAPKLIEALKAQGAGDILVICGGVIPQQDYAFLKEGRGRRDLRAGDQHPRGGAEILGLIRQSTRSPPHPRLQLLDECPRRAQSFRPPLMRGTGPPRCSGHSRRWVAPCDGATSVE